MQRKFGYGLIGAVVMLLVLLGVGWWWNTAVQATPSPSQPEAQPTTIPTHIPTALPATPIAPPSPTVIPTAQPNPPSISSFPLPQETDDPYEVLGALSYFADLEQARFVGKAGWYHLQSRSDWPGASTSMQTVNESGELIVLDNIASANPISNLYIEYTSDGNAVAGINFTKDMETGTIVQLEILDGDTWVNETLRQAGAREEQYRWDFKPYYPARTILENLTEAFAYHQGSSLWAYQKENLFYVHHRWSYPEPVEFVGASGPQDMAETIVIFDMITGQSISSEIIGYLVDSGKPESMAKHTILQQELLPELPAEVADLYQKVVNQ
jgi:hypothetical protein